jgi:hypothetical protein
VGVIAGVIGIDGDDGPPGEIRAGFLHQTPARPLGKSRMAGVNCAFCVDTSGHWPHDPGAESAFKAALRSLKVTAHPYAAGIPPRGQYKEYGSMK